MLIVETNTCLQDSQLMIGRLALFLVHLLHLAVLLLKTSQPLSAANSPTNLHLVAPLVLNSPHHHKKLPPLHY